MTARPSRAGNRAGRPEANTFRTRKVLHNTRAGPAAVAAAVTHSVAGGGLLAGRPRAESDVTRRRGRIWNPDTLYVLAHTRTYRVHTEYDHAL